MKKVFKAAQIRDLLNQVSDEKITFSKFVEILNKCAEESHQKPIAATLPTNGAIAGKCTHQHTGTGGGIVMCLDCNETLVDWY